MELGLGVLYQYITMKNITKLRIAIQANQLTQNVPWSHPIFFSLYVCRNVGRIEVSEGPAAMAERKTFLSR